MRMKNRGLWIFVAYLAVLTCVFVWATINVEHESVALAQGSKVYAKLTQSAITTCASGAGVVFATNIVEVDDPFELHDPTVNPECITIPHDGLYDIHACLACGLHGGQG